MPFFVSDFYQLPQSRYAVKAVLDTGETFMVDASGTSLSAWQTSLESLDGGLELVVRHTHDLLSEVKALACIKSKHGTKIAALLDEKLEVLDILSTEITPRCVIPILAEKGHLTALETDPVLLLCSKDGQDFLILYKYTGFVTIIKLDTQLSDETQPCKRARKEKLRSRTFGIGNVVVTLMAVSENGTLGVLCRDIDFNYTFRCYEFLTNLKTFKAKRKATHLPGAPSHVMAVKGGFLAASESYLWFFSCYHEKLTLSHSADNPTHPLLCDSSLSGVTLQLFPKTTNLGTRFEASTCIDAARSLLILDTGATLLVYIETQDSQMETTVNQFHAVSLGRSTIASGLVHIEDNIFYAGHAVHGILKNVANSAPILDMNLIRTKHHKSLVLSRGGLHCGELEVVLDSPYRIKRCDSITLGPEAAHLVLASKENRCLVVQDDSYKTVEAIDISEMRKIDDPGLLGNDVYYHKRRETFYSASDAHVWNIDDSRVLRITQKDDLEVTFSSLKEETVTVEGSFQISSVDWREDGACLDVYVSLWDGQLAHFRFSEEEPRAVGLYTTLLRGKTTIVPGPRFNNNYLILLLDGEGTLFEMPVHEDGKNRASWDEKKSSYIKLSGGDGTFRMKGSTEAGIIVHDSLSMYLLTISEDLFRFEAQKVHTFESRILDCEPYDIHPESGSAFVLLEGGVLSSILFEPRLGLNDSLCSDRLTLRTISVGDEYVIALETDSTPNPERGTIDMNYYLTLIHRRTLATLHTYTAPLSSNFVDMCLMKSQYTPSSQDYIVVANSVNEPVEVLKLFVIENNRIEPVGLISFQGTVPVNISFCKISCHKNYVVLAGELMCSYRLDFWNAEKKFWTMNGSPRDYTSYYGADVDGNDAFWVMADAVRGPFITNRQVSKLYPIPHPFETSLATAVAVLKTARVFMYGDSLGNIWGAKMEPKCSKCALEEVRKICKKCFCLLFHANLGEQINNIVILLESPIVALFATVKGNIYRVQDSAQYPLLEKQFTDDAFKNNPVLGQIEVSAEHADNIIDIRGPTLNLPMHHAINANAALKLEFAKLKCDVTLL
ncbi:hypothetical protein HF325_004634 [Metschnikowia pulcherrima]|uniref:Uncharacterized protein n=1 Tax=Metschnikowia pulcherrima TaxID=27326 RepID=A0A8H7GNN7_9ASCO|nr:hypothetical protein HF325_004634 [Metschnikowia pulcherrima]